METNDKLSYLENAFGECVMKGKCKTKKQFATLIDVHYTSLISAFNGDEKYLTDSLIAKVANFMETLLPPLPTQEEIEQEMVLVIPTGARAGTLADFATSISAYDCERMVTPIKGADYAMQVTGDSMSPEYPSGSMILIKRINEKAFIEWGKTYVLDTENGAVIKTIRRTDNPDVIECVSLNPAYQPFTMETRYINGWYRVLMVLALK
jgi:phage repressor protein C with HTH and peptisase S24 domain